MTQFEVLETSVTEGHTVLKARNLTTDEIVEMVLPNDQKVLVERKGEPGV